MNGEFIVNNRAFNGDRLRIARIYRGVTAAELAEKMGIKRQTISMYENKKINPELDKIYEMSKLLSFTLKFFS